ncbi:hypothetical protein PTW37_17465 (plasmid) [Arthrobacter agilis]|uniref:hypothetical protein n=1 Tax=Arthrobacter agilis TaxID=37921 RepID=UPI00236625AC|nr:hypothetical protein [Arthrobacter agilis]WDF35269.1 hypothetical protein PTW37_17465 [Arthrobacter agilis]
MIHDIDGSVRTLCLDLDTSRTARRAVVDADAARLGQLLTGAGLAFVEDRSPSGGRHLYIPLQEPITAADARRLVEALQLHAPSLDPNPHQNVTDGCIRVPGSPHKLGGHQMLITPLTEAYSILRRRNPATAFAALRQALAPELHRLEQDKRQQQRAAIAALQSSDTLDRSTSSSTPSRAGTRSVLRSVATTGVYDTNIYPSDSEARMAVLNHFAGCGWTVDQVRTGMTDHLAGLAALYGTKAARLLPVEWAKAHARIAAKTPAKRAWSRGAPIYNTSPTQLTPPRPTTDSTPSAATIHQLVNDLEVITYAILDPHFDRQGRIGISLKLLMRAVLGFMRTNETNILDVGCRSFAVALGKDHVTVARLLATLERESRGIITRIDRGRGRNADTYAIDLPTDLEQHARVLPWRKGKIYGIRPVFRALGDVAALAYEGIERARHSPTTIELSRTTGISRNTLSDNLAIMENLGMIRRHHGAWQIITTTNLRQLAERLGATADYGAQISRYRKERAAWHAWLDRHLIPQLQEHDLHDPDVDEYWLPPADDDLGHHLALWNANRTAA